MESKLVILLVFASLARGSFVPTLVVPYGIPEEQVPVLNQLITNQVATVDAYEDTVGVLFRIFRDLGANTDDDAEECYEALLGLKTAMDLSVDSLKMIFKDLAGTAAEDIRVVLYESLEAAAKQMTAGFKLAQAGNYSNNRSAMEAYETAALTELKDTVGIFYDSFRTSFGTTDVNVLATVEAAEKGSSSAVVHLVRALFNAMKFRAAAPSADDVNVAFISNIEDCKYKVAAAIRDAVEYKFSLLRAQFVNSNLGYRNEIMPALFSNQYAVTVSHERAAMGFTLIFGTIAQYFERIHLGLKNDGKLDFSRNDAASRTTASTWNVGERSVIVSLQAIHPDARSEITATGNFIKSADFKGAKLIYGVIQAAGTLGANHDEILAEIKSLRDILIPHVSTISKLHYDLLRNNQTFNAEIEAQLENLYEIILDGVTIMNERLLDGITLLANAAHKGVVSDDDYFAVQTLMEGIHKGAAKYSQGMSAASLLVLLENNPK